MNVKTMVLATGMAALAMIASIIPALAATAYSTGTVNIRTGPGMGFDQIGKLYPGQKVDVKQCQGKWCYVTSANNSPLGWVSSDYLSQGNDIYIPPNNNYDPAPPSQQDWGNKPLPKPNDNEYAPYPLPPAPKPLPPKPNPQPDFSFNFSFGSNGFFDFSGNSQPTGTYYAPAACFYEGAEFTGAGFCIEEGKSYPALKAWKNRISSVKVFGGATAEICTGINLYGTCQKIKSNKPYLSDLINNKVKSLRVY